VYLSRVQYFVRVAVLLMPARYSVVERLFVVNHHFFPLLSTSR
jgi:hypothetical protein